MSNVNLLALKKEADIRSPETLLERALPLMTSAHENVNYIEVFLPVQGGLVVWTSENSTVEKGAFIPLDDSSAQQKAINSKQFIEDGQRLYLPLIYRNEVFALCVIGYEGAIDRDSIVEMVDDLALMLYTQQMDSIFHQQIAITGKLNIASSLTDVAIILAETMVQEKQFIGMNVFEYDEMGEVAQARVIATANRNRAISTNLKMGVNLTALGELHRLLSEDGEVMVLDINTEERFTDDAKDWLRQQQIHSMFLIPMWIENRLDAFISIVDSVKTLAPSAVEKELFQNVAHQAALLIERQRLLEKSEQRASQSSEQVRFLRLLNEAIGQTGDTQHETPILERTAEVLLEATGVDHVGIVMRDGTQAQVVSEAPAQGIVGRNIKIEEDSIHHLLETARKPLVSVDIANDVDFPDGARQGFLESGTLSVVIIPMFDESDALLGSVGLDYARTQDSIDPDMIETAQTIVTQVALSLQKTRLLAEARQKAEQLERLTAFGQSLRAYLTIPRILATTLEHCPGIMEADYTGVFLYDRPTNSLRNSAGHVHGDNRISMDGDPITTETNSIALEAWTNNDLVKVDDLHADWEWKHNLHRELQSVIAIPLSLAGVTSGVLEVGSANPNHFNNTDVTTLRQISNQLAIALSNAEAYAQSQKRARNKTQANEIIARLQEQFEVSDILSITVEELGKALGAKKARIRLGTTVPDKTAGDR